MSKRKLKRRGPIFQKLDHDYIRTLGVAKLPTLDYSWRRGAEVNRMPSFQGKGALGALVSNSMMDLVSLAKESPATRAAIIAKSKRIAPAFNKGANQYLSDETDPKTIGRK